MGKHFPSWYEDFSVKEKSPWYSQIACCNCEDYPAVTIIDTSFEEWGIVPAQFDAVLAATSFHWISCEVSYAKAAEALKTQGSLILL